MKKILTSLVILFVALSSQFVMAEDSKWYSSGGAIEMSKDMPMSNNEFTHICVVCSNSTRTENTKDIAKSIGIGYKVSSNIAIEAGYVRGGGWSSETVSSTTWGIQSGPGICCIYYNVPQKFTQKTTLEAMQLSVVGTKDLNDAVSLLGRIGLVRTTIDHEERYYEDRSSLPLGYGNGGSYTGWSSSTSNYGVLYSVGLTAKVAEGLAARFELMGSSTLSSVVPKIDLTLKL